MSYESVWGHHFHIQIYPMTSKTPCVIRVLFLIVFQCHLMVLDTIPPSLGVFVAVSSLVRKSDTPSHAIIGYLDQKSKAARNGLQTLS